MNPLFMDNIFLVEVFFVVMLCSVAAGYIHFGEPCCLHLQTTLHGITTQKTLTWVITMKTSNLTIFFCI